ncbi:hypothetical protein Leryth_027161 [Lithospermum erythrorhizon]|nr:hypothetical protein Leryth_027161 [Lithospermum erythrorhizon]
MDPSENSCWWKLPEDIQADILRRVAGKDLISLKLVSWEWYGVISYICMPRLAPPSPDAAFCGFIYRQRLRKKEIEPKPTPRRHTRLLQWLLAGASSWQC